MKKLYAFLLFGFTVINGTAQIVTIPDANFKAKLISLGVDTNFDGNIQQSEALAKTILYLDSSSISNLSGISSFSNLTFLSLYHNNITDLTPLNGLNSLRHLYAKGNQITGLSGLNTMVSLEYLDISNSPLSTLAGITSFPNLKSVSLYGCDQLTSISDLGSLTQLEALDISFAMQIPLSFVNTLTGLKSLYCRGRMLTSTATFSNLTNLTTLSLGNNQFTSLNLAYFPNLRELDCDTNNISSLNLSLVPNLTRLDCFTNNLSLLNLSSVPSLTYLDCSGNHLSSLSLSGLSNLQGLYCSNNNISYLDVSASPNITMFYCLNNNLTTLDASNQHNLAELYCDGNPNLTSILMKNGSHNWNMSPYGFDNCPNLAYICADDDDISLLQDMVSFYGYTNCHVNSYCSFSPGGVFYTIQGNNRYDGNNNGCDSADANYSNLKLTFSNGWNNSTFFANNTGSYHYDMEAGTHSVTPTLENPNYFTISPASATVNFPNSASPYMQDFCISANGTHNDLEVVVLPTGPARPGFNATYKIVYKNKGTNTQNGTITLSFYDPIEDFVSANPNFNSQSSNLFSWNFSNLLPFETREITVVFNLNSPVETPPVNAGNIIIHTATIQGASDETPTDNSSALNQTVVNSFDPNDKTCLEGSNLPISEVGKYLHYIIRFENTGSANAENIVVKDMIDTSKFDITTLTPLNGSHNFETKISSDNKVEFIFQNINLPFDDAHNDGYVAFKIKTLPTVTAGQSITNSANIYFDYNMPIITNTNVVNVYNPLSVNNLDFGQLFSLSPVPAKDVLNITPKQNNTLSSASIYNTLGQLIQVITTPSETIDVSGLTTGTYFIKIISDKGTATSKFLKE